MYPHIESKDSSTHLCPIRLHYRSRSLIVHPTAMVCLHHKDTNSVAQFVQTTSKAFPFCYLYYSYFSAVVFVLVLHLSFVISNYMETFGGYHLPPVAYSTSSTRCPLHRCLASTNITRSNYTIFGNTNFHRSFTSFVHMSPTIVQHRLKQGFYVGT